MMPPGIRDLDRLVERMFWRKLALAVLCILAGAVALEEFCEAGTMLRPIERREALRTALEQQAEPVAWMTQSGNPIKFNFATEAQGKMYGWEALYTAPPQRKPLTDEQADQIISGLQTCHHQSSKREFLKVWLRDWAAHGIKEMT